MKLESQVTSLEISQKLHKLGVKQESYFNWDMFDQEDDGKPLYKIMRKIGVNGEDDCSAFTVAELGEMLPWDIIIARNIQKEWHITFQANGLHHKKSHVISSQENEADARGKMLIYLIDNGLIKI